VNLALLLDRAGRIRGERPAVLRGVEVVHDWAGLRGRAARLAGGLRQGLAPGDRVALVMRNHPAYVELLLACWWAGLAAVPVNARLHPSEIAYILDHAGCRLAFVTDDLAGAVAPLVAEVESLDRVLVVGGAEIERLAGADPAPMAEAAPDDLAWLFYTSGTTGRPKGAMLTHRNLLTMSLAYYASVDAVAPCDALIHAAPMSHGSGLYMLPFAARGARQVIPPSGGFEPEELLRLIEAHPGACLFAAPTMVKRLAEHPAAASADLVNLKMLVYGGGPMYRADLARAEAVLGHRLAQIYGQGESPMTITALDKAAHADTGHPRYAERTASVGTAQMGIEVRIADADDRPLPPGEVGEVLARGASVMRGYWRDPEASARTLAGGWLHTGDLGSLDEDGFLTLSDRSKDLIISGGSNIYPREVEEVLLQHPSVAEVAVVGALHPDWGEQPVAFVVRSAPVDPAELEALCLSSIARYKRPRLWRFVDALPKNNYGKVVKTELRRLLAAEG
jgi:long-chain acyl-CoA synthetase